MLTGVSVESKALAMKQSQNNCLVADGLEELCLCVEAEDTRAGGRCVVAKALQEVQEEQSLCKGLVQGSSEISALERLHSFCISDSSAEVSKILPAGPLLGPVHSRLPARRLPPHGPSLSPTGS